MEIDMTYIDPHKLLQDAFGEQIDWYEIFDENPNLATTLHGDLYDIETPNAMAILAVMTSPSQMAISIGSCIGKSEEIRTEIVRRIHDALQYYYAFDQDMAAYFKWNTANTCRIYLLRAKFSV